MKLNFKSEDGQQITLDQFLKPTNPHRTLNKCNDFLIDEPCKYNSSVSDYELKMTQSFQMRPAEYYKPVKNQKNSPDAIFFEDLRIEHGAIKSADNQFANGDTKCTENEKNVKNKDDKLDSGSSNNLMGGILLVANSPPSDAEASMPVTANTSEVPPKHDLIACFSISLTNQHATGDVKNINLSKSKLHKRKPLSGSHRVGRPRTALKCFGSSRKRRVQKRFHKEDLSSELLVLPRIHTVTIGDYELEPPYTSPLPLELVRKGHVYVCEKCLDFKESKQTLERHMSKCCLDYPPGDEIFRQDDVSIFEVDGNISKAYSQNLCLLAKLFIDHKTLFYDVEPFLFYVLTVSDSTGNHLAGYFSKQKYSTENNLSCILTLPSYQNKGYGRFLIDFTNRIQDLQNTPLYFTVVGFLLTRREGTTGTPERPLSDLGNLAYRSYWRSVVLEYFKRPSCCMLSVLTIEDISKTTGVLAEDIIQTAKDLAMFQCDENGQLESFVVNRDLIEAHWAEAENDTKRIWIDEDNLKWEPKQYKVPEGTNVAESEDN